MIKIIEGMNDQEINEKIDKLKESFTIVDKQFSSPRSGYYAFAIEVEPKKEKPVKKKTKKKTTKTKE